MSNDDFYVKERIEELRSRISLVESSLKTIDQDFWVAFSSAMQKNICPPLLYPSSTFSRLTVFVNRLKASLFLTNLTASPSLLKRLDDMDNESMGLLTEIVRLQNVLSQRTAGTGLDKLLEYKSGFQSEFCIL